MAARAHDTPWRFLISFIPLLGAVMVGFISVVQGRPPYAWESPTVLAILGAMAALGASVCWWTAHSLRSVAATTVASASPGLVSLHGYARALPGAAPLVSPNGVPCLWFRHRRLARGMGRSIKGSMHYEESVRPFLLVDDSGRCIVLPAGADVEGDSPGHPSKSEQPLPDVEQLLDLNLIPDVARREKLLLLGDLVHVSGWLIPNSSEAIDAQQEAAKLAAQTESQHVVVRTNDEAEFKRILAEGTPPMPASPLPAAPLGLPVVGKQPSGAVPFIISIGAEEGQGGGFYVFIGTANTVVLCAAGCMYLWLTFFGH